MTAGVELRTIVSVGDSDSEQRHPLGRRGKLLQQVLLLDSPLNDVPAGKEQREHGEKCGMQNDERRMQDSEEMRTRFLILHSSFRIPLD